MPLLTKHEEAQRDIAAYDAAVLFIRLSDTMRVYEQAGIPLTLAMVEHHNQVRERLDSLRPPARVWHRWRLAGGPVPELSR